MEKFNWLNDRSAGVLMHVSCFPSSLGIGCFDANCRSFIQFLASSGMKYWQVCPLHPTSFGDSPYQSVSAFAGNPYFIDLTQLVADGFLCENEIVPLSGLDCNHVDFGKLYIENSKILHLGYLRFEETSDCAEFCKKESPWLDDFSLFMALKEIFGGQQWLQWPKEWKDYRVAKKNFAAKKIDKKSMPDVTFESLLDAIKYHKFVQWQFEKQWKAVRNFAVKNGIEIIGDMPIFVGLDSADVWAHKEIFKLDRNGMPKFVAGVPPDEFSATGQLWGNPVFDWNALERTDYAWWHARIKRAQDLYDIIRLDHFRGFYDYWEIPADEKTAIDGEWRLGGGEKFFKNIAKHHENVRFIAEDLGILSDGARNLLKTVKMPGMSVLQFAFDGNKSNGYLPYLHERNSALYVGTHDNNTTRGWYDELSDEHKDQVRRYLQVSGRDIAWDMLRCGFESCARLFIISMQDILCLGSECRFNMPGSLSGNWTWRMSEQQFENLLCTGCSEYLRGLCDIYGR